MRNLAADGMAILFVTSDLDEVLALSDRILVMANGRVTGDFPAGADAAQDQPRDLRWAAGAIGVAALLGAPLLAAAHGYPNRPLKFVVPFPPGGAADTMARLIAPPVSKAPGRSTIIQQANSPP